LEKSQGFLDKKTTGRGKASTSRPLSVSLSGGREIVKRGVEYE